jgi:LytS/YehU family sensor histidine kinase
MALALRYLEVERFRFGDRLVVDFELEDGCAGCAVPPLLLQPLVENAVRHGIAHLLEGGTVRVRACRKGETLRLEVENPCDEERPASDGEGIGLANVRRRLKAAFGERATFSAQEQSTNRQPVSAGGPERHFRVMLSFPCQRTLEVEER